MTQETNGTGEKDGKQCNIEMEMATGGRELKREEEMKTMCCYIRFVSTSTSHKEIEQDGRRERRVTE